MFCVRLPTVEMRIAVISNQMAGMDHLVDQFGVLYGIFAQAKESRLGFELAQGVQDL